MPFNLGKEKGSSNPVELTTERRLQNTVVYGSTGSGKSRSLLLSMAMQQMEDTSSGATFICTRGDMSWLLDRLANKMDREVIFLHPDSDKGTHDFLETEYRTGFEMQKNLIDYVHALEEKKIVIVDFDLATHRQKGERALIKLLYHLQRSIVTNTEDHPHFVYIDDAELTLPYIKDLLLYGKDNAVGTTLLLSSYSLLEAKSRALSYFINAYTNSTIVMNRLTHEDLTYFNRRFYGNLDHNPFKRRGEDEIVVETVRNGRVEVIGVNMVIPNSRLITELEEEVYITKVKRHKRKRPRQRGVISDVQQTNNDVEYNFNSPEKTAKVFLDEEAFLANL